MHITASEISSRNTPPPEYEAAMDDLQRRADLGQLTVAQARREISELRERLALDAGFLMQWAMRSRV